MRDIITVASEYQIELFQHIGEFFGRATGMRPAEFASLTDFDDKIRADAHRLAYRLGDALVWADTELRKFYSTKGIEIFRLASQTGGIKLVLGGSSRFQESQLGSVRGALLYADTVLIPDPVFPWFERERAEEKFRHVLLLKAAHTLLHLRPLVDEALPHCPVLVFPSWEKSLEEGDPQTITGTLQLLADVFATFVDPGVATAEDVAKILRDHPDAVLRGFETHKLLVAPGGAIGDPVVEALKQYEDDVRQWRSAKWLQDFHQLPLAAKATSLLLERLQPQYHLLENAEELGAHPLLSLEQQAHYFKIISEINSERLEKIGLLDKNTKGMLAGLQSDRMDFLSDLSIETLLDIRRNNENEAFRRRMKAAIDNLHGSSIENIDLIAAEMCREIHSGISDHMRTIREIDEKFKLKNKQNLAGAALTAVAFLWPSLAPFLGAALPIAVASKFGWDALEKYNERKKQSRSLMGVLARQIRQ